MLVGYVIMLVSLLNFNLKKVDECLIVRFQSKAEEDPLILFRKRERIRDWRRARALNLFECVVVGSWGLFIQLASVMGRSWCCEQPNCETMAPLVTT
jgi:hypothetical protein